MSPADLLELLNRGGTLALLLLIIWGGQSGWYVWRREHEELLRDRDFWRDIALKGLETAERSLDLHQGKRTR